MAKGELSEDLEKLKSEYTYKISQMSTKFRNYEYNYKIRKKMAEVLASYMSSLDELEQLLELHWKAQQDGYFKPSKYSEYKKKILNI